MACLVCRGPEESSLWRTQRKDFVAPVRIQRRSLWGPQIPPRPEPPTRVTPVSILLPSLVVLCPGPHSGRDTGRVVSWVRLLASVDTDEGAPSRSGGGVTRYRVRSDRRSCVTPPTVVVPTQPSRAPVGPATTNIRHTKTGCGVGYPCDGREGCHPRCGSGRDVSGT